MKELEFENITLNVREFPVMLRRQLKAKAAIQGVRLRDYIIDILQEHVDKDGGKGK